MSLPGYDAWKIFPPEPICDDPDCSCTEGHRDEGCLLHGKDPDAEYDNWRDAQMEREMDGDHGVCDDD